MSFPHSEQEAVSFQPNVNLAECIIWTRPAESWENDLAVIQKFNLENKILRLPCTRTIPILPEQFLGGTHHGRSNPMLKFSSRSPAYAFTSAKAVEICVANKHLKESMSQSVAIYAVGQKTLESLKKHGFIARPPSKDQTGEGLSELIASSQDKTVPIILPGAKVRAFDLERSLIKQNFRVHKLDIYETIKQISSPDGSPISVDDHKVLNTHLNGTVIAGAPSAVEALSDSFSETCLTRLTCVAIGLTTAKAAKGVFSQIKLSKMPTFESMLELILNL